MTSTALIRVLIADSNAIFRQGLQAILAGEADMQVVGQAADAREAVAAYAQLHPDVTILDLRMPEMECLNAIKAIRAENPKARIVILTAYDGAEDIVRGLRAGASGYLLKEASPAEVIETVRAVHAGKKRVDPDIASKLAEYASADDLSESERKVLNAMAEGKSNPQIAEALTLSESTIKFHVNNILLKLDVSNRTEAVVAGLKRGLVRLS
ncbi:MAG: two component transcriptional regulator, LuxR family [Chthonomonadaceae bacterium]|nr:two component transcriptional regulator, LuxR family [Chthonomonadaceae bacterium]